MILVYLTINICSMFRVYVNLNNSFVDQISRNSRNCFCLVKACLTSADTCIITSTTELQAEESINGKVSSCANIITAHIWYFLYFCFCLLVVL